MTPQELAVADVRRLAVALLALGGSGTVDEITAASGMPRNVVVRRLAAGGLPGGAQRAFSCERQPVRSRKAPPSVWRLTGHGKELAATPGNAACDAGGGGPQT